MRYHLLTAALVAGGLLATGGSADAQYGYSYPPGGGYPSYAPAPPFAPPRYHQPSAPVQQFAPPRYHQADPHSGYGGAGYGLQSGGGEAKFVRSLYHHYLGREPEPQGMDTWLRRLADFRGDTDLLTREFLAAAQLELDSNRRRSAAYPYAFPSGRPGYR